jgi:hypothetical protein
LSRNENFVLVKTCLEYFYQLAKFGHIRSLCSWPKYRFFLDTTKKRWVELSWTLDIPSTGALVLPAKCTYRPSICHWCFWSPVDTECFLSFSSVQDKWLKLKNILFPWLEISCGHFQTIKIQTGWIKSDEDECLGYSLISNLCVCHDYGVKKLLQTFQPRFRKSSVQIPPGGFTNSNA